MKDNYFIGVYKDLPWCSVLCLGIPGVVVKKLSEIEVLVDFGGIRKKVDALLVPDIKEGDYVIVHAGAIISKITKQEFDEMVEILRELGEVSE